MAIEIVDFPINSMVIFHCYVSSPEGTQLEDIMISTLVWPDITDITDITVDREKLCRLDLIEYDL